MLNDELIEQIYLMTEHIPVSTLNRIIGKFDNVSNAEINEYQNKANKLLLSQITELLPNASARYTINKLFEYIENNSLNLDRNVLQEIATAIKVITFKKSKEDLHEKITLVWTGPESKIPVRQTRQALTQLIENAERELLIVSFVVFKVPEILSLLETAIKKGVKITCIFESPDESDGKIEFQGFREFSTGILREIDIYVWDKNQRLPNSDGKFGTLHAKCAIADQKVSFISSANLTTNAMTLNMELGVLIYDIQIAREITIHFEQLRLNKVLKLRKE